MTQSITVTNLKAIATLAAFTMPMAGPALADVSSAGVEATCRPAIDAELRTPGGAGAFGVVVLFYDAGKTISVSLPVEDFPPGTSDGDRQIRFAGPPPHGELELVEVTTKDRSRYRFCLSPRPADRDPVEVVQIVRKN